MQLWPKCIREAVHLSLSRLWPQALCWKQIPVVRNSADRSVCHNYPISFIYLNNPPWLRGLISAAVGWHWGSGSCGWSGLSASVGRRTLALLAVLFWKLSRPGGAVWHEGEIISFLHKDCLLHRRTRPAMTVYSMLYYVHVICLFLRRPVFYWYLQPRTGVINQKKNRLSSVCTSRTISIFIVGMQSQMN